MRESKIEHYFVQQVVLRGGTTRKLLYYAAPDRMVIWPPDPFSLKYSAKPAARIHFVELKATEGKVRVRQKREHARLRELGCAVFVIYSKWQVDEYIRWRANETQPA